MPLTVVYIDLLFLINACVDYVLLLCTAKICGAFPKRRFLLLASLAGGVYAVGAVFLRPLSSLPAEILWGIFMSLVAFGAGRALLKRALVFLAVSAAFAGVFYSVSMLGGGGGLSVRALVISFALCYAAFSLVFRKLARGESLGLISDVTLILGERKLRLKALRDTGNSPSDPLLGKSVIIIERECVKELLPYEQAEVFFSKNFDAAEIAVAAGKHGLMVRLVPYSAVGTDCGLLPAFSLDCAVIDGKKYTGALAAVSPTPLSDGGGHRAIIGG